jgi:hypothetical protein
MSTVYAPHSIIIVTYALKSVHTHTCAHYICRTHVALTLCVDRLTIFKWTGTIKIHTFADRRHLMYRNHSFGWSTLAVGFVSVEGIMVISSSSPVFPTFCDRNDCMLIKRASAHVQPVIWSDAQRMALPWCAHIIPLLQPSPKCDEKHSTFQQSSLEKNTFAWTVENNRSCIMCWWNMLGRSKSARGARKSSADVDVNSEWTLMMYVCVLLQEAYKP